MTDIKTEYSDGDDVEFTRRGLMNVKIKQTYDNQTQEYETTFVSRQAANQFAGVEDDSSECK